MEVRATLMLSGVCLEDGRQGHSELFYLSCFSVMERLTPQLIQVGASPS